MTIKYTTQFYRIRYGILNKDNFTCQHCGKRGIILDVHHIIPLRLGGSDDISNLITLCRPCHGIEESKLRPKRKKGSKLIIEIPKYIHKKLKMKALHDNTTLKDIITPLLERLVK